jgi:hypothetical protein
MSLDKIRYACIAVLLLFSGYGAAEFNDGIVAHLRGDYASAMQHMLPLAETSNHPLAQYYVGAMYANGQGVEQDFTQAAKWYDLAAKQGVAPAQFRLGELYAAGKSVPLDLERAYAWFSVAAKAGHSQATSALKYEEAKLSPAELANAKALAAEYVEKYGKRSEPNEGQAARQ